MPDSDYENIATNPDGQVMYLSAKNPYVALATEDDIEDPQKQCINEQTGLIGINIVTSHLTPEIYIEAKLLERQGTVLRWMTVMDFAINIFNAFFGSWIYMIVAAMSYLGYRGAKEFRKSYIVGYLVWLYLQFVSRFTLWVAILSVTANHSVKYDMEERMDITIPANTTYILIISTTTTFLQAIICYYCQRFYNKLPNIEGIRRDLVSSLNVLPTPVIHN